MKVSEIFRSIQGEGANAGIPMTFIRLTGCNVRCSYCDTAYAFEGGKDMTEEEIAAEVKKYPTGWVCLTGGEPFMQEIETLTELLKREGYSIHIETNGTVFRPVACDWLVVSPKRERRPVESMLKRADEIKLVVSTKGSLRWTAEYSGLGKYRSVQPESNRPDLLKLCIRFVETNPEWRLSVQMHKLLNIR